MGFTIPNSADAENANQAEVDKVDFDILGAGVTGNGVLDGCAVTAQGTPDQTVAVASGNVRINTVKVVVTSGNVALTAANAANPRFDLICVNSGGTKASVDGTAAAEPVFPAIPANSVVLAAVYRPANDNTVETPKITDKRVTVGGLGVLSVDTFDASGTWTKPTGAVLVMITAIGAGGGGGSGRKGAAGTDRYGGGGGVSGGVAIGLFPASTLGATENVVVAAGGAGGAAIAANDTNGNVGGTASSTYVGPNLAGSKIMGGGGTGGGGGLATAVAAGESAVVRSSYLIRNTPAPTIAATGFPAHGHTGGGGSGGGIPASNSGMVGFPVAGGDGTGGSGGAINSGVGGNGTGTAGAGGGGGGVQYNFFNNPATNPSAGGAGGTPGGGGAGGGAAVNGGANSGAGGTGGTGRIVIVTFG